MIWKNSTNEQVLERARAEIRASCGDDLPPVYDPFSGGGSIPLEAQRLGLPAYGSDLNPVAVMIGKAMIEIPPRFKDQPPVHPGAKARTHYRNAEGLAEDVRFYGEWMREQAWQRIGHLYPQIDLPKEHGGGKATVFAWIWARTVPSPDPAFVDVAVPLVTSFVLRSEKGKEVWIEPIVDRVAKTIEYRIRYGGTEEEIDRAKAGTSAGKRQAFRCIMSGAPMPYGYIRDAGKAGEMGQKLIAIVADRPPKKVYVAPSTQHEHIAQSATPDWQPETELTKNALGTSTPNYGLNTFSDLFTPRQLVALTTFSELIHEVRALVEQNTLGASLAEDATPLRNDGTGSKAYAEAVSIYLAFVINKCTDYWSSHATWMPRGTVAHLFARHAIPMTWDFPEANPIADDFHCSFVKNSSRVWKSIEKLPCCGGGKSQNIDAQTVTYPARTVISTDPPYYDNIGYADLSDFFFCWMKPLIRTVYPELFDILATPKTDELVATPYRHGGREAAEAFFISGMTRTIANMADQSSQDFPTTIYYAFKQSEIDQEGISSTGWATFLQAVGEAGYAIIRTWPMRTEKPGRMIAIGTNALANSVVLVCRKKEKTAETANRAEFIRALKRALPPAIAELQAASISPADMPQSAIGPGMAVFSKYKAVLEADDSPMSVRTALQLINEQLDEFLNDLHGEFDPETRFAATWFEQHGTDNGDYGAADNLARARGISVESVADAGIVASAAGKVRILQRKELPENWDPHSDTHLTVWECCQHLIRRQQDDGEQAAARLLKQLGADRAEMVKDLAYYLYDVCTNKRKDAKEATAYNGLVAVWSDLTNLAVGIPADDLKPPTTKDLYED